MGNQTEASSNVMERFEQLYLAASPRLYRFFSARVSDDDTVEDLTAETFFRARRKWPPRQSEPHQVQAWLFQIGRNLLGDHYRSNGRCPTEPLDEATAQQPQADPGHERNIETLALKNLFGEHAYKVAISSTMGPGIKIEPSTLSAG